MFHNQSTNGRASKFSKKRKFFHRFGQKLSKIPSLYMKAENAYYCRQDIINTIDKQETRVRFLAGSFGPIEITAQKNLGEIEGKK
jgi:hypothetical protein